MCGDGDRSIPRSWLHSTLLRVENPPFMDGFPIKTGDFGRNQVSLLEGN